MTSEKTTKPARLLTPSMLVVCLWALAVVSIVVGFAAGLGILAISAARGELAPVIVVWVVAAFAAGCCVAGVLFALAWLCRSHHHRAMLEQRIAAALEGLAGTPASSAARRSAAAAADALARSASGSAGQDQPAPAGLEASGLPPEQVPMAAGADPLLEEIRELNINLLLSDSQRQVKRQYLTEQESGRLGERIERAIAAGQADLAEALLDRLLRLWPDLPSIEGLRERIEQARAEAEASDVAEARKRVENLMSVSEFPGAEAAANGLLARYPASAEAIALLERVRREAQVFAKEQRSRMYRQVEKEASARHWRAALTKAEHLLATYPNTSEAEAVRAQLETLRENARIEEVRWLRDQIRDMIARRRFADAVEMAKDVIARFPRTAAANQLREQMPRLEELAQSAQEAGE